MADSGTTTLNFGAFPGSPEASVDVTGQTGFVSTSEVEAWVMPVATADHSVDEHLIENLKVMAHYQADGTIRIKGSVEPFFGFRPPAGEGTQRHRLFGQFTVGWVWA